MDRWLRSALDYIPSWMDYQMSNARQPGCLIAIAYQGRTVLEKAFGQANLATGDALTPRHRFRIASHSKSFTAAGILKLRERGKLKLDDTAGSYIDGLHRSIARATLGQLLSHSAGIVRDGPDSGFFIASKPFPGIADLRHDLASPTIIDPGLRLKYSNHGYGLLGLVIAAVAAEPYRIWIKREIIDAAGLKETLPDMPLPRGTPFARGHTGIVPLGRRIVVPGDYSTEAIGPAGGFVSTAADTALFFNQLSPEASRSVLSAASRREMVRRQWRNPHASLEGYYGLGTMSGTIGGWDWFGHSGGLQGYVSRTVTIPAQRLTVSIMSNSNDGWAGLWVDGAVNILRTFAQNGAPGRRTAGWKGRWWSAGGALDLVPMGDKVMVGAPGMINPFLDTSEIHLTGRDSGRVALANGYASHGEPVRRVRTGTGRVREIWIGAGRMVSKATAVAELERRFGTRSGKRRKPRT
jgi:CubicO group peptidase (beta-lactamase class C family)